LQQRDAEPEGLAGAGLRLSDDVVAGQGQRERHLLDRERVGDADGLQGLARLGQYAELSERRQGCLASSSPGRPAGERRSVGAAPAAPPSEGPRAPERSCGWSVAVTLRRMTDAPSLDDPAYHAAVVDLLGVLAYGELSAFVRLAADAALAPRIGDEAQL